MEQKNVDKVIGAEIGCRCDGVDPSVDYSDPMLRTYVHKDVVKKTGETEDDFIIEQKPVLVDEINVQKQIDEASKGADLKSLVNKVLQTGDESFLNQREVSYGDITGIPTSPIQAHNLVNKIDAIKAGLPDGLKNLDDKTLMSISKEDIQKIIKEEIEKRFPDKVQKTVTIDNAVNQTAGKETV